MSFADLPALNAFLNGSSAVFLTIGYVLIRRRNQTAHRNCMIAAFLCSILFLASYITYHAWIAYVLHRGPTVFREPAGFRPIYLFILGTHTVLAMVVVPMVLATLYRAFRRRLEDHRRLARWTWPVWMYVSITGVLIYLLLYRIFPQTAIPVGTLSSAPPL